MIKESYIMLDKSFKGQDDFFKSISNKLIEDKIVIEGYYEALVKREKDFPTGLPVNQGVAIPHLSNDYSLKNQIVYVRLAESISFTEMGTDDSRVDVKHVFFLILKEGQDHIEFLSSIINLIQEPKVLETLSSLNDADSVKEYLEKHIGGN